MNIDNLTFGELKQISALFGNQSQSQSQSQSQPSGLNGMIGKKCIVRTYSAGVWFGEIAEKSGNEVIVKNARRMWQWWAEDSISLSGVALHGIKHNNSKIAPAVDLVWLEAIELIPASDNAIVSIESAPDAKAE